MIYFASDIHLGSGSKEEQKATEQKFVQWLECIEPTAEALFLVGDIFDFWFEYNRVVPKGFVRTLGKIAQMIDKGIRVVMFTGNHDMWVASYLTEECGVELYTTPQILELAGKRIFISHGDNTNIKGDIMLKIMNAMFRSKTLRFFASWLVHPDLSLKFGHWWSGSSRKRHAQYDALTEALTEPLIDYARTHARTHEVDDYLFGHMHYARDYRAEGLHVVLLGAWDCYPSYAVLDAEGSLQLKKLDL